MVNLSMKRSIAPAQSPNQPLDFINQRNDMKKGHNFDSVHTENSEFHLVL